MMRWIQREDYTGLTVEIVDYGCAIDLAFRRPDDHYLVFRVDEEMNPRQVADCLRELADFIHPGKPTHANESPTAMD